MLTSLFSLFYVTGEFHRFLHQGRAMVCMVIYILTLALSSAEASFAALSVKVAVGPSLPAHPPFIQKISHREPLRRRELPLGMVFSHFGYKLRVSNLALSFIKRVWFLYFSLALYWYVV